MRREDVNDAGLYCYDTELQCSIQKKVFPLGTLQIEHFPFEGYQWKSRGMEPMTLAFPPQETRKKFSVTVSFKRQQEAKWEVSLLLRGFQSQCRGLGANGTERVAGRRDG